MCQSLGISMNRKLLIPLFLFSVAAFSVWEIAGFLSPSLKFVLPRPSSIFECFLECPGRILNHAYTTFLEMAGGLMMAMALAFPSSWGMYRYLVLRGLLQPLFLLSQSIPMFVLAPIMVFWFDWSFLAIIIPTAMMIFFPLTMSLYQGFCSVPQHFRRYFQLHKATPGQTFWKLLLPWAAPHLISGIRVSAGIAGIGAIAGEWAGGQAGLGVLMIESRRNADLELTFAALFTLAAMSLAFYGAVLLVERRFSYNKAYKAVSYGLCIVFGLSLSSCRQKNEQKGAPSTSFRLVLDWLPNPNHVPIFAGLEKGIFKKHGLDLQLSKLSDPGDAIPLLSGEKADIALYYMPETAKALKKGIPLAVVGFLYKTPLNAFIFRSDSKIRSPRDLNGKKIGYSVGYFGRETLNLLLEKNRIEPAELYNVHFDLVGTLAANRVDVIYGAYHNIETEHLRSLGIETDFLPLEQFGHQAYFELIFLAKKGTFFSEGDFVAKFKAALQESIEFSKAFPEEAFKLYCQANPDKRQKTIAWEQRSWMKTFPLLADNQEDDESVWRVFLNSSSILKMAL